MALSLIEGIGVIAGVLGFVQFGWSHFGPQVDDAANIHIQVGLDTNTTRLSYAAGDLPIAHNFRVDGVFLGSSGDRGTIQSGTFRDYKVHQITPQQPAYTLFRAQRAEICVALASITWPDGQRYAWTGGFARLCDLDWYYSDIIFDGNNTGDQKLDCMWIDADGDQPYTGFQVYWPAYAADPPIKSKDFFCNDNTVFGIRKDHKPKVLNFNPKDDPSTKKRRTSRAYPHEHALVISTDPSHSPLDLCQSSSSWGPDFLNLHHGLFCQTVKKMLWPICTETVVTECFDVKEKQLIEGGVGNRGKTYTKIHDWTHGGKEKG